MNTKEGLRAELAARLRKIKSTQTELSEALTEILTALVAIDRQHLPSDTYVKTRHATYYNKRLRREIEGFQKKLDKIFE